MVRLACLAVILLISACSVPTPPASPDDATMGDATMGDATMGEATVYVIRREWHTDIGLAVEAIAGPLTALEKPFPGVRFLTFGFGERQFLVDHRKDFGSMLVALLPSQSALLMTALSATPEQAFGPGNVVVLRVSRAGLAQIEAAIWREFGLPPTAEPTKLADGPYPGSVYYAASDTYFGLFTCNTWTAETLRAGGLPMPAAGVLFAGQVMGPARWISTQQGSRR